jgi:nicotinamidase-related amidase/type 1 glutamine amidotransferase
MVKSSDYLLIKTRFLPVLFLASIFMSNALTVRGQKNENVQKMRMSLQKRMRASTDTSAFVVVNEIQEWNPKETAIIICDMWDQHWCEGATDRVSEMAPSINNVVSIARQKGVLIVHSPSNCMSFYENHPARKLAQKYKRKKPLRFLGKELLDSEKGAVWPIDQEDGGCDCTPECKQRGPYTRQIALIDIKNQDAISEYGDEIAGLFEAKGIKNVILMGVHENMCVIGRPFGLRNMVRLGKNVVVMRDLTDTMYDSKELPVVPHFTGTSLMTEYIEKYVCPSMVSSDFTGQKQFRFKNDKRPVVAFIIAENEYQANQTLPEFAHDLLLAKGVTCEFALGKSIMTGPGVYNIENLQILKDADLAVIFVRRRALPSEEMNLIKEYVSSGKPVLGIRTASHAFDAQHNVPREGGSIVASKESVTELLDQWPEFDKDVLGGNYQGHYGNMKEGIMFSIAPGMESHPILKGVSPNGFVGPVAPSESLYKNKPLSSENIQVLLLGTIPGQPSEPVLWINHREKGQVIYTSLGHWDHWKIDGFHNLMVNSVGYLLNGNK